MHFQLRLRNNRMVDFSTPAVMGVINVSPNSFYNPCTSLDSVLRTAESMVVAGADILDLGGEATNPKVRLRQERPSLAEELDRVLPAVELVRKHFSVLISIDTSRADVMREAVHVGADLINDQRALTEENALATVASLGVPVCLMHFFHQPRTPGSTSLPNLLKTIKQDLQRAVTAATKAGIAADRLIIDPGFGQGNYGKNCEENYYLLNHLKDFLQLGFPILSGWSRKSMIGESLGGRAFADRLYGSVAADTLATFLGAHVLRTHDVAATKDAAVIAAQARLVET